MWLRFYKAQLAGLVPPGRDEPLWRPLRRLFRALGYDAARAMFSRANAGLVVPICRALSAQGLAIAPRTCWARRRRPPSQRRQDGLSEQARYCGCHQLRILLAGAVGDPSADPQGGQPVRQ